METTLGTAASQSVGRARLGARWPRIAVSGLVLLGGAAGAIALVLATRDGAPEAAPAGISPSREDVTARPDDARETTRTTPTLTVITEPPGAVVRIDGSTRGKAPLTVPVELGRRLLVEAEHEGFESAKQTVTASGEAHTVTITLAALPATTPADAAVPPPLGAAPTARSTPDTRPSKPPRKPARPASGSGTFDPNDVSGD